MKPDPSHIVSTSRRSFISQKSAWRAVRFLYSRQSVLKKTSWSEKKGKKREKGVGRQGDGKKQKKEPKKGRKDNSKKRRRQADSPLAWAVARVAHNKPKKERTDKRGIHGRPIN
jgi:hypothetical protein